MTLIGFIYTPTDFCYSHSVMHVKKSHTMKDPIHHPAAKTFPVVAEKIIRFLISVRLTLSLLIIIGGLSLLAAVLPQNQPPSFYQQLLPGILSSLVTATAFSSFFHSALFLVLVGLFFTHLAACAVTRVVTRIRHRSPARFGPDIIHLGLLVGIIAGLISLTLRQEAYLVLQAGDSHPLPDGYSLTVDDLEYAQYADGRPRHWISRVAVRKQGITYQYCIEVNKPLVLGGFLGGLTLYQSSFNANARLVLRNEHTTVHLALHEGIELPQGVFIFMEAPASGGVRFARLHHDNTLGPPGEAIVPGRQIGPYMLVQVSRTLATGLQVVKDPSTGMIVAALILIGVGLILNVIQKLKEES